MRGVALTHKSLQEVVWFDFVECVSHTSSSKTKKRKRTDTQTHTQTDLVNGEIYTLHSLVAHLIYIFFPCVSEVMCSTLYEEAFCRLFLPKKGKKKRLASLGVFRLITSGIGDEA